MNIERKNSSSKLLNYLRYSGVSIIVSLNPLWWKAWPWFREETNNEFGSAERTWAMGFLGLTIRIWVDRGDW